MFLLILSRLDESMLSSILTWSMLYGPTCSMPCFLARNVYWNSHPSPIRLFSFQMHSFVLPWLPDVYCCLSRLRPYCRHRLQIIIFYIVKLLLNIDVMLIFAFSHTSGLLFISALFMYVEWTDQVGPIVGTRQCLNRLTRSTLYI